MSYSRSQKLTSEEKRLRALKTQLYGKETSHNQHTEPSPATFNFKSTNGVASPMNFNTQSPGASYLSQDLLKIGVLSVTIFIMQGLLFLSLHSGLLKL